MNTDNNFDLQILPKGNVDISLIEDKGSCINLIGKYIGGGGGSSSGEGSGTSGNVDIIKTTSNKTPSDKNVYSSLRSRDEFLCKSGNTSQTVDNYVTIKKSLTVEQGASIKDRLNLGGGFLTDGFTDSGNQIYGAHLTTAGMLTVAGIKAMSFEVYSLIYNVVRAQGGQMVISNAATIESCQYVLNGTGEIINADSEDAKGLEIQDIDHVILKIKKEDYNMNLIPFRQYDILYGYATKIGESGEAASGGQSIMYVTTGDGDIDRVNSEGGDLIIEAKLFEVLDVGEIREDYPLKVPVNVLPINGMAVAQRGNTNRREGRMSSFFIDALSGNLYSLDNVTTPTIFANQYGVLVGTLPTDLLNYVNRYYGYVTKDDPVVYAKYGIFENFLHLDHQGKAVATARYRGLWDEDTAAGENPYMNTVSMYDTVTHDGSLWACQRTGTHTPPSEDSNDWIKQVAKGEDGTSIKIKGHYDSLEDFKASENPKFWDAETNTWLPPDDSSDCYVIGLDLYVWTGLEWQNVGPFKGEDGKSQYLHIAYANVEYNEDGSPKDIKNFSTTSAKDRNSTGTHVDHVIEDSSDPNKYTWKKTIGATGARGTFKSTIFIRSVGEPNPPEGGTYDDPVPDGIGWEDGIPSGSGPIWSSHKYFYDDSNILSTWSKPKLMLDSTDFEVIYCPYEWGSVATAKSNIPEGFKKGADGVSIDSDWLVEAKNSHWYDDPKDDEENPLDPIYMATINREAGQDWDDSKWVVTKVKGEKGDPGDDTITYSIISDPDAVYIDKDNNIVGKTSTEIKVGQTTPHGYTEITKQEDLPSNIKLHYSISGDSNTKAFTDDFVFADLVGLKEEESIVLYLIKTDIDEETKKEVSKTLFIKAIPFIREGKPGANGKDGKDGLTSNPNLIRNSNFDLRDNNGQLKFWGNMFGEVVENGHLGHNYFHFDSSTGRNMLVTNLPMDSGETYTLSFEFNREDKAPSETGVALFIDTSNGNLGYVNGTCMNRGNESIRYYYNFRGTSGAWERNYITITNITPNSLNPQMYLWIPSSSKISVSMIKWEASGAPTPYLKAQDDLKGNDPYLADIDNEMDSISLNYLGQTKKEETLRTNVSIWKGVDEQEITDIKFNYTEETVNSWTLEALKSNNKYTGEIKITIPKGVNILDKVNITITVKCAGASRKLTFTINGVKAGSPLYRLLPSSSQIVRNVSNGESTIFPNIISCEAYSEEDGIEYPLDATQHIRYTIDGVGGYENYSEEIDTSRISTFIKFELVVDGNVKDRETLYIVDGAEGLDGLTPQANLIRNSNFDLFDDAGNLKYYANIHGGATHPLNGSVVEKGYDNYFNSFKIDETNTQNYIFRTTIPVTLVKDKTYTISCVAKNVLNSGSTSVASAGVVLMELNKTNIKYISSSNTSKNITAAANTDIYFGRNTTWEAKSFTFEYTAETPKNNFNIYYYCWYEQAGKGGEISQLKFEVGNQATPYCKHIDDLKADPPILLSASPSVFTILTNPDRDKYLNTAIEGQYSQTINIKAYTVFGDIDISNYTFTPQGATGVAISKNETNNSITATFTGLPSALPSSIKVNFTKNSGASMGTLDIPIIISERGLAGPQGEAGAMLLPYGNWDINSRYSFVVNDAGDITGKPVVYYKDPNLDVNAKGNYFVLKKNITVEGIDINNNEYWSKVDQFQYLFTEALMANYAKLGSDNGAIFYDRYLFSQYGQNNTHYSEPKDINGDGKADSIFDEYGNLSGSFIPKIHLDFLNGLANLSCLCEPFYTLPLSEDGQTIMTPSMFLIEPEKGFNIKIPFVGIGKYYCKMPLIVLPQFKDGNSWLQNGAHITIMYEHGGSSWGNTIDNPVDPQDPKRFFVIVSVDVPKQSYGTDSPGLRWDSYAWNSSYIMCRGRRSKYLMLAPGTTVKLKAVEFGGYIHWNIENESSITEEKVDVYNIRGARTPLIDGLGNYGHITPSNGKYITPISTRKINDLVGGHTRVKFYGADYSDEVNLKTDYHGVSTRGTFLYAGPQGYCPKNIIYGMYYITTAENENKPTGVPSNIKIADLLPTQEYFQGFPYRMLYTDEIDSTFVTLASDQGGPLLS